MMKQSDDIVDGAIKAFRLGRNAEGNDKVLRLTYILGYMIHSNAEKLKEQDTDFLVKLQAAQERHDYLYSADLLFYVFPKTHLYTIYKTTEPDPSWYI